MIFQIQIPLLSITVSNKCALLRIKSDLLILFVLRNFFSLINHLANGFCSTSSQCCFRLSKLMMSSCMLRYLQNQPMPHLMVLSVQQYHQSGLVSSLSSPVLSSLSKCSLSTSSKSALQSFFFPVVAQLFSGSGKSFGGMVYSGSGVAGLLPSGIGLNHIVVDTLGMWALSVSSRSETCPSSYIGVLSEDCSDCSDSGSDLCIKESHRISVRRCVSDFHPVEEELVVGLKRCIRLPCTECFSIKSAGVIQELKEEHYPVLFIRYISTAEGRDVVIVVASVLIGGGVTSDDGLVDETSVKGAITGGVDVTV
ncbi:hypothetical protein Tco_0277344 [Tanacetum coccineum]